MMNPFSNQNLHNVKLENLVVMRGKLIVDAGPAVDRIHLVRDDHQPNRALRFIKGYIFQTSEDGVNLDNAIACKLTTVETAAASFDASDYNQIAWMSSGASAPSTQLSQKEFVDIVDPSNIISHDLFAEFWMESGLIQTEVNYLFMFESVDLDDTEALVVTLDNYMS